MKLFHFGESEKRLCGCLHEPPPARPHRTGIVLCHAMGQEYIRSYRTLWCVARRLAEAGFPVLRFDYFGCGDSFGDRKQGSMRQWREDIRTAIRKMERSAQCEGVALVGLRLGASMAVMVGSELRDVNRMMLWNPVWNGKAYLKELIIRDLKLQGLRKRGSETAGGLENLTEAMGFPIPTALRQELSELDLSIVSERPAEKIVVLETSEAPNAAASEQNRHALAGCYPEYKHLVAPRIWIAEESKETTPMNVVEWIVSWFNESCA